MSRPIKWLVGYSTCNITRSSLEAHGHDAWTCDVRPANHEKHIVGYVQDVALWSDWGAAIFHPMCTYLTVASAWALRDPDYDRYPGVGYHQKVKPETLTGIGRRFAQANAVDEIRWLMNLPYPKAIENPAPSSLSTLFRSPNQIIQPYEFGDDASKSTGLWLDGLPILQQTCRIQGRFVEWPRGSGKFVERWGNQTDSGQNRLPPSENRWLERSATYPGIAKAFGDQWGRLEL